MPKLNMDQYIALKRKAIIEFRECLLDKSIQDEYRLTHHLNYCLEGLDMDFQDIIESLID
jgi:hypothetical protein